MSKFLCSGCGACCLMAGATGLLPDRGDGACIHLDKDMSCKIYENRPEICRVDELYHKIKDENPDLSQIDWNILNTKECHKLIDLNGLDPEYKINIDKYVE